MSTLPKRPREPSPPRDYKRRRSTSRSRDERDSRSHHDDRRHHHSSTSRHGPSAHRDRRDDDRRDRHRDKDRDKNRDRGRERDKAGGRERHTNGRLPDRPRADMQTREQSEKEEGEISGPSTHASPSRASSAAPSSVTAPPAAPGPAGNVRSTAHAKVEDEDMDDFGLAPAAPLPDPEQLLAERRAKRQAILAKYASQPHSSVTTPRSPSTIPLPILDSTSVVKENSPIDGSGAALRPLVQSDRRADLASQAKNYAGTPGGDPEVGGKELQPEAGDVFDLTKNNDDDAAIPNGFQNGADLAHTNRDQISAADYNPDDDRRVDEMRRARVPVPLPTAQADALDDEDDMFAIGKKSVPTMEMTRLAAPVAPVNLQLLADSGSDEEGYYRVTLGEILHGGKYRVFEALGKGMFSGVVRARVLDGPDEGKEVAIKIIRAQETMYKAGLKEVQILNKLMQADPDDKKHVIRLETTFEHRGHLCLVFESLSMNLRDVVKRFGKDVGLNIKAVRAYAQQMLLALSLFKKCSIMHADIKPDNILVNENKTVLKVCDLGSASDTSDNEITPYLVSRFYRAPEIILGLPYDTALDIWSIGCTLYELYTGKILFPGRTNNHMLLLMMELKGRFNNKLIKKAHFGDIHFDEQGAFLSGEQDKVTGGDVIRKVHISKPTRDLRARLMPSASSLASKAQAAREEEIKIIAAFVDLLDKCLTLDPARRITPKDALLHPFFRS